MDKDFEIVSNIKITHPQKKILQAKKIDIVNYYNDVAKLMLPFLDKRLLSVIRVKSFSKNIQWQVKMLKDLIQRKKRF